MISLGRAMKQKKRLIGRINEYKQDIICYNVYDIGNAEAGTKTEKIDISEIYKNLIQAESKLVELKVKISKANVDNQINELIHKMEEKKDYLTFLNRIPIETNAYKMELGDKAIFIERVAQLNRDFIKNEKLSITKEIEDLQDKIDAKNATVEIDYEI